MKSDPKIRLVIIYDLTGKIIHADHREGVKNLDYRRKSLELVVNSWKTRNQLATKIGKGKYALAEYEKIKRITMPLGDEHLLYVTTELEADHSVLIDRITKLDSQ